MRMGGVFDEPERVTRADFDEPIHVGRMAGHVHGDYRRGPRPDCGFDKVRIDAARECPGCSALKRSTSRATIISRGAA